MVKMRLTKPCEGFLCSHVDSCNKKGSCSDCECYCLCLHCLFTYNPDSELCWLDF